MKESRRPSRSEPQLAAVALVLAGGRGSRLWPLSTPARPKAFAHVLDDESLLTTQVRRARSWCGDRVYVAITRGQEDALRAALPGWDERRTIVGDPTWDTAGAIAEAARRIALEHPDAVLLLLSPDQHVSDDALLFDSLRDSVACARSGPYWVSVGVRPTEPSTALGYMRLGPPLVGGNAHLGLGYVEKPDAERARELSTDGSHLWNVGLFAVALSTLRAAFALHAPAPTRLSIDHAVLEKLTVDGPVRHAFVEGQFAWTDVGTWAGLSRALAADHAGNRVRGIVDHASCRATLLVAARGATISAHGLGDRRVVVSDDGSMLVTSTHREPDARLLAAIDGHAPSAAVETTGLAIERRDRDVRVQAVERAGEALLVVDRSATTTARRAAEAVARALSQVLAHKERATFVPSVGATMTPIYAALVRHHREALDWTRVTVVQMDELVGVRASFRASLLEELTRPLRVGHVLTLEDVDGVLAAERYLARHGLDVALHGIGANGHIAFHEPGGDGKAGLVTLAATTRAALGARLGIDCTHGVTLGLPTLRRARATYLVATGATKRSAVRAMLFEGAIPASSLLAPTVFTDRDASPIDAQLEV